MKTKLGTMQLSLCTDIRLKNVAGAVDIFSMHMSGFSNYQGGKAPCQNYTSFVSSMTAKTPQAQGVGPSQAASHSSWTDQAIIAVDLRLNLDDFGSGFSLWSLKVHIWLMQTTPEASSGQGLI